MASPRIEQGLALVTLLQAALTDAGLTKAIATMNAAEVPSGSRYGVVVVAAPELDFATWNDPTPLWEVHVVAGPATDYLAAWDTIDTIIQAFVVAQINLKTGTPGQYQPFQGVALPAYTLSLNPLDLA
ncbi:hypothetical protein [Cryobacterium sp. Y62]|uniref:hypothetical protein n=1 Tax=Cryobacterium sp. Y62 TaxID=2048284 RepID=UPI000CE3E351|nr:hypothetical protein [Cryobacterium sp. Y62]